MIESWISAISETKDYITRYRLRAMQRGEPLTRAGSPVVAVVVVVVVVVVGVVVVIVFCLCFRFVFSNVKGGGRR